MGSSLGSLWGSMIVIQKINKVKEFQEKYLPPMILRISCNSRSLKVWNSTTLKGKTIKQQICQSIKEKSRKRFDYSGPRSTNHTIYPIIKNIKKYYDLTSRSLRIRNFINFEARNVRPFIDHTNTKFMKVQFWWPLPKMNIVSGSTIWGFEVRSIMPMDKWRNFCKELINSITDDHACIQQIQILLNLLEPCRKRDDTVMENPIIRSQEQDFEIECI